MNNNSPTYKRIREFISLGYDSFDVLPEMEKDELVAMQVDAYDQWINHEEIFKAIKNYIYKGGIDNALDLAEIIRKHATSTFTDSLELEYQEAFDDYKVTEMQEHGLSAHVDPINGEVTWRK